MARVTQWRFGASDPLFKNNKTLCFQVLKNMKKIFRCSQLFITQTCKNSYSNILYFGLHKNDKRVDLLYYMFSNLEILP
jgi:hypothetical protein